MVRGVKRWKWREPIWEALNACISSAKHVSNWHCAKDEIRLLSHSWNGHVRHGPLCKDGNLVHVCTPVEMKPAFINSTFYESSRKIILQLYLLLEQICLLRSTLLRTFPANEPEKYWLIFREPTRHCLTLYNKITVYKSNYAQYISTFKV
jgi:hypothetical protein